MAEYIEREALIAAYDKAHKGPPGGARKLMEDAPAVDVVEVCRCKDCENRLEPTGMCMNPMAVGWDALEPNDDDFCSRGKRRYSDG